MSLYDFVISLIERKPTYKPKLAELLSLTENTEDKGE